MRYEQMKTTDVKTDITNKMCENLKRDCLTRIRDLQLLLDGIKRKLESENHSSLNTLGELQGVAVILDCRLASLATLRMLKEEHDA